MMFLHRHLCTTTTTSKSSSIPWRYRKVAVRRGQQALTEYLHATRCIPYVYADQIAKNSLLSLTNLITKLGTFSPSNFPNNLNKFLRYNPINEFEFFFESIGIHPSHHPSLWPHNKYFFSEDESLFDAACALSEFGFPWDKLGVLYVECGSVFKWSASELKGRLCWFKRYGFCNVQVMGVCLAFPSVFGGQLGSEIDALLADLRLVFLDFDLEGCVEGNVDAWYEVCRKIKVFYDLNGGIGKIGEVIGRNKHVIVEHGEGELVQAAGFFSRFGAKKEELARLILESSELLSLDLEMQVINVLKLLKHFGMSSNGVKDVRTNYAHALGTIRMANLPNVMKALGLNEWFFDKIKDGNHMLLVNYVASYPDENLDKRYLSCLEKIRASRTSAHCIGKLNFLLAIGFGENALTMNVFSHLHGTGGELKTRFDCLLHLGIEFSKVFKMISICPRILNHKPELLEQKISFFCQEMGKSVEDLVSFPAFLCFDLENRIKPRYRFHMWLLEKGLSSKKYSIASLIASSNKTFVARAFKIHPAALKHWFEQSYPSKLPVQ
ncbi:transcription termination factor MTEF18, mitochondrial [Abrus precatorius]|uniref:Transcription termination factor MTEF18, mitochondrial n=1 Tax=Abrus precatorius TaxID=3816 RepID=A0A8B8JW30_ABRPR|nr:transcription termination factor MTEF18, mitochondrial [Abrus precatorius]XP_027334833.1 transcription termination factor MTEF18, mitochondrial [Abrus precatorius]